MKKIIHLYSKGDNVLFRKHPDYIFFNNRFAALSYEFAMNPLGLSCMSTHFHALIEPSDARNVEPFIKELSRMYAIRYAREYDFSILPYFNISSREVDNGNINTIQTALDYVLRNPVHHYISKTPFAYPYGSAAYIFMNEILQAEGYNRYVGDCSKVKDLSARKKQSIIGRAEVPDGWLVNSDNMIIPTSYLMTSRIKGIYSNSVNSFLYHMNKSTKDADQKIIDQDILDLRSGTMNDIEVCSMIDEIVALSKKTSIHHLTKPEQDYIVKLLVSKGISCDQICRCLWLINTPSPPTPR